MRESLFLAERTVSATPAVDFEGVRSELRQVKGSMHLTLCQLADKALALEDSERRRASAEADVRAKAAEIEVMREALDSRDAQLSEMAEEVERLEAMNRRLEVTTTR